MIVLFCAVAGYSILSISQAGQKIGLHTISSSPRKGWAIWILSTTGTAVSFFLVLAAIGLGSVALVGAMTGVGMASLTVFSRFVLRESVGRREIIAVIAVAVGAGLVGIVPLDTSGTARINHLYWLVGAAIVIYGGAAVSVGRRHHRGIILGGLAGSMAAFSQLFQKLGAFSFTVDQGAWALVVSVVTNRAILISVVITVVSMLVAQIAYTRGQAIRVIPSYTAHASAVPVIGGMAVFNEQLQPLHWSGVVILFAGTMLLVWGPKRTGVEGAAA
jgi:drug/metabolite transporter (DMT)-like permease